MGEKFGALIWLAICALSVLFWWPVLVVVGEYWIGVTVEEAATPLPEPEDAAQIASSAPRSDTAALDTESAYATEPSYSDEEEVSLLLAHAQDQVAKLALTTPEGDNAYETYQLIRSLQPNNQAALGGIKQIGVKYAELAKLAAKKGDLRKANHYAAKAAILAPEHPLVLSITIPMEADQPKTKETTPAREILANVRAPPSAPEELEEETAKVQVATATPASATPEDLIENVNDLVFKPYDYQGRQLAVAGPVVHVLWDYRLKAETGQNSIVIDVDGLNKADRAGLDAAIEKAGFLGQVHARIKGRIERQGLASFELAATELALTGFAKGKDEASGAAGSEGSEGASGGGSSSAGSGGSGNGNGEGKSKDKGGKGNGKGGKGNGKGGNKN